MKINGFCFMSLNCAIKVQFRERKISSSEISFIAIVNLVLTLKSNGKF